MKLVQKKCVNRAEKQYLIKSLAIFTPETYLKGKASG